MRDVVTRPNGRWQIYFQDEFYQATTGRKLNCVHIHGVSRSAPACYLPKEVQLRENIEFTADIQYSWAWPARAAAHVVFRDTEARKPYHYVMSGEELKEFFRGLRERQIRNGSRGFTGRFTFVKKGTSLFTRPIIS